MTDRADLIRRLEEMASDEDFLSTVAGSEGDFVSAKEHDARAALLREAVKALEGGTTNDPVERYCYVNCGLPAEQCACYRSATKAT